MDKRFISDTVHGFVEAPTTQLPGFGGSVQLLEGGALFQVGDELFLAQFFVDAFDGEVEVESVELVGDREEEEEDDRGENEHDRWAGDAQEQHEHREEGESPDGEVDGEAVIIGGGGVVGLIDELGVGQVQEDEGDEGGEYRVEMRQSYTFRVQITWNHIF